MVQNFQRILTSFPILFQLSLYMQKLSQIWVLKKYIFFKYFAPPKMFLNLQQSKSRQNGLKISKIDCTEVVALTYTFFTLGTDIWV